MTQVTHELVIIKKWLSFLSSPFTTLQTVILAMISFFLIKKKILKKKMVMVLNCYFEVLHYTEIQ